MNDLVGRKFGRLVVVSQAASKKNHKRWRCFCECGAEVIVYGSNLMSGDTKSCGCYQKEIVTVHGDSRNKNSPYRTWEHMMQRCKNPKDEKYKYYGAKGIKVCSEWEEYKAFREWAIDSLWHKGVDIHRLDSSKAYEPDNCIFVTRRDHASYHNNVRKVNRHNKFIENLAELMNKAMEDIVHKSIEKLIKSGEWIDDR